MYTKHTCSPLHMQRRMIDQTPNCLYVGNNPTQQVEMHISAIESAKAWLTDVLSPSRPNTSPPIGRMRYAPAYTAYTFPLKFVAFGKNAFCNCGANSPNRPKSNHSNIFPIDEMRTFLLRSRLARSVAATFESFVSFAAFMLLLSTDSLILTSSASATSSSPSLLGLRGGSGVGGEGEWRGREGLEGK